ncbi:hypothetical protein HMPREF0201_01223 [Cedecea davisae DSM 4568]|uniref:Uncharacterized protein n=1 Tax=Cedecea davisae DSM 4568 TaxID=566551 RepID=S3K046_9ENTR|nr:hypothetical protein HMPREF0201_01223 [Cedecea davisae DSM 4568]
MHLSFPPSLCYWFDRYSLNPQNLKAVLYLFPVIHWDTNIKRMKDYEYR